MPVGIGTTSKSQVDSSTVRYSTPERINEEDPVSFEEEKANGDEMKLPRSEPTHRKSFSVGGVFEMPPIEQDDQPLVEYPVSNKYEIKDIELEQPHDTDSVNETDSSVSHYVSLLRARGHKRTSSAPVAMSSLPPVMAYKSSEQNQEADTNPKLIR